ncbi:MAG: iron-containing alcohol dehydrogenase [Halobacteriovoraceae bacterium]|jgi:alcohol dehydrogenase class IV|nr:iron-containing alcohol dehydrogenase [Halobacteriovoraceae bacterium]MBT5095603.1 iron-containing alcohol dehydrogenase [Halobacteriovoraceae bacterium]
MNWNTRSTFNFPCPIRFGPGVIDELGAYLKDHNLKAPLFVTDQGLAGLPFYQKIIKDLGNCGLKAFTFTEIDKNPVKANVLAGKESYINNKSDCIIGMGGGASMDVARAIALIVNHDRDLFDFDDATDGWKYVENPIPHFITIPTTSGTGSEVGRSTVISEDDSHQKRVLFAPQLMAKIVFADPALTLELPAAITAATGMDALTHNIEAFVSKGYHPLCDGIALEGCRLVAKSLVKATKESDLEARTHMMAAAMMGATAFQKGLGVVHSTAHPLSTLFNTHHGLANAIMLPYGIEYNSDNCPEKYAIIAEAMGLRNPGLPDFLKYIDELNAELGLPKDLHALGVELANVEALSELAIKDVCHLCNPKPCTQEDFVAIYKKALP